MKNSKTDNWVFYLQLAVTLLATGWSFAGLLEAFSFIVAFPIAATLGTVLAVLFIKAGWNQEKLRLKLADSIPAVPDSILEDTVPLSEMIRGWLLPNKVANHFAAAGSHPVRVLFVTQGFDEGLVLVEPDQVYRTRGGLKVSTALHLEGTSYAVNFRRDGKDEVYTRKVSVQGARILVVLYGISEETAQRLADSLDANSRVAKYEFGFAFLIS